MPMADSITDIPEHIPGEPALPRQTVLRTLGLLSGRALVLVFVFVASLPAWPLYLVLRLFLARPPHYASAGRHLDLFGKILTTRPRAPGVRFAVRVGIALTLFIDWALVPFAGLAWYLDMLLYGRALRAVRIVAPIFEISAARSGSTQLAHYLEDDPGIRAPSVLQTSYPYIWLWKLAAATLGRLLTPDTVRKLVKRRFSEEFLQRHELDPYRTDTFEVLYGQGQLAEVIIALGPELASREFAAPDLPADGDTTWSRDFPDFIDALGRKVLLAAQMATATATATSTTPRLMIKGHFLRSARDLERRYPDARFLTVLRAPDKRIQSVVNYIRVNPADPLMGYIPWPWLIECLLPSSIAYCEREMAFYQEPEGAKRCVVRFDDYVKDLEITMQRVYRECLDQDELPPHVPRQHAQRVRENYAIDRSLEQLGVDVGALNRQLSDYRAWCKKEAATSTPP